MMEQHEKILVSVIIPTYNRPKLVLRAISSVLNQTYQNFEVVVMDDSRNEDTANAIGSVKDSRVRYTHNLVRLDFCENKNQGVKNADHASECIAFLDDDDEYLPMFLEKTVDFLDKHKDVFAVTTYAEFKTQDGELINIYPCECESWKVTMGNGWVLRKSVFFADNIWYDKSLMSEDLDFGIAVAQKHKWKCLPEVLRVYYGYPAVKGASHSTSFTKSTPTAEVTRFLEKNFEFYKRSGPKALAWAHFLMGKMLCRANQIKEGRRYLKKAFYYDRRIVYLFYYLLSVFSPWSFGNMRLAILKNKFKNKIKGL